MTRRNSPYRVITAIAWANLLVVFAVELAGLVAFGVWGYQAVSAPLGRWALAILLALAAAVVWGLFCAPRAAVPPPRPVVIAIKVSMLAAAVLALLDAGLTYAAIALAAIALASALLAHLLPHPASPTGCPP